MAESHGCAKTANLYSIAHRFDVRPPQKPNAQEKKYLQSKLREKMESQRKTKKKKESKKKK